MKNDILFSDASKKKPLNKPSSKNKKNQIETQKQIPQLNLEFQDGEPNPINNEV